MNNFSFTMRRPCIDITSLVVVGPPPYMIKKEQDANQAFKTISCSSGGALQQPQSISEPKEPTKECINNDEQPIPNL